MLRSNSVLVVLSGPAPVCDRSPLQFYNIGIPLTLPCPKKTRISILGQTTAQYPAAHSGIGCPELVLKCSDYALILRERVFWSIALGLNVANSKEFVPFPELYTSANVSLRYN